VAKGSDPTDSIVTVVNHHHNALVLLLFQTPKQKQNPNRNDDITQHLYDYYETSSSSLTVDTYGLEKLRSMANERWMIEPNILYTSYMIEFCLVFWFFHKGRGGGGGTEGGDYNCYPCVCYDSWLTRERIFVFSFTGRLCDFPDVGMGRSRLRCVHPCTQKLTQPSLYLRRHFRFESLYCQFALITKETKIEREKKGKKLLRRSTDHL
jgi:hypothetical protein